jgi:hypothetical protein
MSIGEKMEAAEIQDALARLFAGREPREGWLARCPTLEEWRITVADASFDRRAIYINGRPTSDRFKVSMLRLPGGWRVLWMDRKFRFALTRHRLWKLGASRETDVGMDFTVPGEEQADD